MPRLDTELVSRGLAASRQEAHRLIEDHKVVVNGSIALKAARQIRSGDLVEVSTPLRFVSRGGEKLQAALDAFGISVASKDCLDIGASTGGFTDCLLQGGAKRVRAVDVGRNLLHERLLADERVEVFDGVNVRLATPEQLGGSAELVVVDVSFISLRTVMSQLAVLTADVGDLIALVKPQFEAGRAEVSKAKGVIKSSETHQRVLAEVAASATKAGFSVQGTIPAPQRSPSKNQEFLLHAVMSV